MRSLGLAPTELRRTLAIGPGEHALLDGTMASALAPQATQSWSIHQYKSWLGVPDELARKAPRPQDRPAPPAWADGQLSRSTLENAAFHFLFGDSSLVLGYEAAIDAALAPFPLTAYVAGRVELHTGACLRVTGGPTALAFDSLVLHPGSRVEIYTLCNVHIGTLEKRQSEES